MICLPPLPDNPAALPTIAGVVTTPGATDCPIKPPLPPTGIESLLACPICLNRYTLSNFVPKLLPCHHSFCVVCLENLAEKEENCECPTCRKTFERPESGKINDMQTNFYIAAILDSQNSVTLKEPSQDCGKGKAMKVLCQCFLLLIAGVALVDSQSDSAASPAPISRRRASTPENSDTQNRGLGHFGYSPPGVVIVGRPRPPPAIIYARPRPPRPPPPTIIYAPPRPPPPAPPPSVYYVPPTQPPPETVIIEEPSATEATIVLTEGETILLIFVVVLVLVVIGIVVAWVVTSR